MAETLVENQVCGACGAEVRKGALFCYHCGAKIADSKKVQNEVISDALLRENISKGNGAEDQQSGFETKQKIRDDSVAAPIADAVEKSSSDKEIELKSAAAMRRKPKSIQPKRIEIIWEEHENTPNLWFVLVTVFLAILVAVILFLAMRLR